MTVPSLTRLHITPLNPDLLPIALGPTLSRIAQNIVYQNIQTFPENDYGFLDLPPTDAKRLISKLNGAILKGRKMKVEEARPKRRVRGAAEDEPRKVDQVQEQHRRASKEPDTLEGYELPQERKVKRGWTEPKIERSRSKRHKSDKEKTSKSQAPSKYTNKEELLFHTNLPLNKGDLGGSKKSKNPKHRNTDHTVHEFEKTYTQPSFLRDPTTTSNPATHFVDGKGWVNEEGEVVENEPANAKRRRVVKAQGLKIDVAKAQRPRQAVRRLRAESRSESPKLEVQDDEGSSAHTDDDETSSSGDSVDGDVQVESAKSDIEAAGLGIMEDIQMSEIPKIEIQPAPETPTKVHPLEALFKKPKRPEGQESAKPSLEVETAFSFFDPEMQDDEEDNVLPLMPVTPFTSQDLNSRGIRSAAPTPDTAHPSRFAGYAAAFESRLGTISKDTDNMKGSETQTSNTSERSVEPEHETEFQKRFWAERAQNNRAWKTQRRTAVKGERQKENRSRKAKNR